MSVSLKILKNGPFLMESYGMGLLFFQDCSVTIRTSRFH
jgi:hypothetical protein